MRTFILGTDWWTDCDDAVALRILARAHKASRIQLAGIAINACMEHSVTSLDGFLSLEGVNNIPIAIDLCATDFGGNPPYQKTLSKYANNYQCNSQAEDAVLLYRRILAAAEVPLELIEIGYPQVLAKLLQSQADEISSLTGLELVKRKVSKIWMMAGKWDTLPDTENNFARNTRSREAAHIFCDICPVPVTFLGWEVGYDVITGDELEEHDPLYVSLCEHGSPNGRSSWDPMLCQLALDGNEKHAGYSIVCGKASVDPQSGKNYFVKDISGPHKYVVKQHNNFYYAKMINALIN